jgi:hypothetical protein
MTRPQQKGELMKVDLRSLRMAGILGVLVPRSRGNTLDVIRGSLEPARASVRTVAALTDNPGCTRRRVIDAARVRAYELAEALGHPVTRGQSPFAITSGNRFEQQLKGGSDYKLLVEVLRPFVGLGVQLGATPSRGGVSCRPRLAARGSSRRSRSSRCAMCRSASRAVTWRAAAANRRGPRTIRRESGAPRMTRWPASRRSRDALRLATHGPKADEHHLADVAEALQIAHRAIERARALAPAACKLVPPKAKR